MPPRDHPSTCVYKIHLTPGHVIKINSHFCKNAFHKWKKYWKCDLVGFANRKKCSKARERNMHNSNTIYMLHRGILYAFLSRQGKWQKKLIGIYPLLSFVFQTSPENWIFNSYSLLIEFDQMHSRLQDKTAPFEECA